MLPKFASCFATPGKHLNIFSPFKIYTIDKIVCNIVKITTKILWHLYYCAGDLHTLSISDPCPLMSSCQAVDSLATPRLHPPTAVQLVPIMPAPTQSDGPLIWQLYHTGNFSP